MLAIGFWVSHHRKLLQLLSGVTSPIAETNQQVQAILSFHRNVRPPSQKPPSNYGILLDILEANRKTATLQSSILGSRRVQSLTPSHTIPRDLQWMSVQQQGAMTSSLGCLGSCVR